MKSDYQINMIYKISSSIGLSALILATTLGSFVMFEPAVSFAVANATSQFTVKQVINTEISFLTPGSNIVLAPSLGGITGGDATGTVQVVVLTNNRTGYNMTIMASSSGNMVGEASSTNKIGAYTPAVGGTPDFNFTVAANGAEFGFTAAASTTADLALAFQQNGSSCGIAGSNSSLAHCWMNSTSTTPGTQVINTSGPTSYSGSTTTLAFHVKIMPNPLPEIPNDTYTATTTLTASVNP